MRKNIVAGNWKMNTDISEAKNLAQNLKNSLQNYDGDKGIIVAPPFTNMSEVGNIIKKTKIIQDGGNKTKKYFHIIKLSKF